MKMKVQERIGSKSWAKSTVSQWPKLTCAHYQQLYSTEMVINYTLGYQVRTHQFALASQTHTVLV